MPKSDIEFEPFTCVVDGVPPSGVRVEALLENGKHVAAWFVKRYGRLKKSEKAYEHGAWRSDQPLKSSVVAWRKL